MRLAVPALALAIASCGGDVVIVTVPDAASETAPAADSSPAPDAIAESASDSACVTDTPFDAICAAGMVSCAQVEESLCWPVCYPVSPDANDSLWRWGAQCDVL